MSGKSVLIIEPDETVKNIIQKSILGFDPTSTIESALDAVDAMRIIQEKAFDFLMIDVEKVLTMGESGFKHFQNSFPKSIQIVVTGYANTLKDLPKSIQDTIPVVRKPIDQRSLTSILSGVIGPLKTEISQQASLSSRQYQVCQQKLLELRHAIAARCIFLSDSVGSILVSAGDSANVTPELMASLLGGGIATLQEAGKVLSDEAIINLTYREGTKTDLYAINVGTQFMIIILIDKKAGFAKMGSIWYYARQTALSLNEYLNDRSLDPSGDSESSDLDDQAVSDELDRLFKQ